MTCNTLSQTESQINTISRMSAPGTKVYNNVGYEWTQYRVTGCEISVLSTKVLPNLSYRKYDHKLYAANMPAVPVLGIATVAFRLGPAMIENDFLVSQAVEELIFGAEQMSTDFATESLNGITTARAIGGHRKSCMRHVYTAGSVDLEPYSQRDLVVKTV